MLKDFNYSNCRMASDVYSLSSPCWPEAMTIVSKTNLNYNKPAANGVVVYKFRYLINEIEKVLNSN